MFYNGKIVLRSYRVSTIDIFEKCKCECVSTLLGRARLLAVLQVFVDEVAARLDLRQVRDHLRQRVLGLLQVLKMKMKIKNKTKSTFDEFNIKFKFLRLSLCVPRRVS